MYFYADYELIIESKKCNASVRETMMLVLTHVFFLSNLTQFCIFNIAR